MSTIVSFILLLLFVNGNATSNDGTEETSTDIESNVNVSIVTRTPSPEESQRQQGNSASETNAILKSALSDIVIQLTTLVKETRALRQEIKMSTAGMKQTINKNNIEMRRVVEKNIVWFKQEVGYEINGLRNVLSSKLSALVNESRALRQNTADMKQAVDRNALRIRQEVGDRISVLTKYTLSYIVRYHFKQINSNLLAFGSLPICFPLKVSEVGFNISKSSECALACLPEAWCNSYLFDEQNQRCTLLTQRGCRITNPRLASGLMVRRQPVTKDMLRYKNSVYIIIYNQLTYENARSHCGKLGMYLFIPDTKEEYEHAMEQTQGVAYSARLFWIGVRFTAKNKCVLQDKVTPCPYVGRFKARGRAGCGGMNIQYFYAFTKLNCQSKRSAICENAL